METTASKDNEVFIKYHEYNEHGDFHEAEAVINSTPMFITYRGSNRISDEELLALFKEKYPQLF